MPVMIISENEGQTPQGYDGMLGELAWIMRRAPGFIAHMSYPTENGWRVVEVWESQDDAARFSFNNVVEKPPAGIRPKRSFHRLHAFVTP